MFSQTFYHKTIRKYVTYFGTLFNDIYINRTLNDSTIQTLKVPLTYAPKNKALARLEADPELNRPASVIVPFMAFEMTGMTYDPMRKLTTTNKGFVKISEVDQKVKYVYNPVPYNISFSLYILVKNAEDGTKILEQILPYFTPDWTATLNLIPDLDVKMDIPVVIQNVRLDDSYEGSFDDRRIITWTLDFEMNGYLFGPVKKGGPITLTNINFYESFDAKAYSEKIDIRPGLTADGKPTTNVNATIDRNLINKDDDWDYIILTESIDEQ
jgi:hypothetical protein